MQSHSDNDFDWQRLQRRANDMVRDHASEITAGKPGEDVWAQYKAGNGMHVTRRPDDEQGILRISVGGGGEDTQMALVNYCVVRGDPLVCAALLDKAAAALREGFV